MRIWKERVWRSDLSSAECVTQLESCGARNALWRGFWLRGKRPGTIHCSVNGDSFCLFASGSTAVHNLYEPYFYGRLVGEHGRTTIRGRFLVHPLALVLTCLWVLGAISIGGLMAVVAAVELMTGKRALQGDFPWIALMIGPAMLVVGGALVGLGWRMGESQRQMIESFLEHTLQGHLHSIS